MARLDRELVGRGLARSRTQAQNLITRRLVQVNGEVSTKSAHQVSPTDQITLSGDSPYVSRAAHKLIGALDDLDVEVAGRALDAGASTGGFTQVLLERGCDPVYAIDVGHGQLDATIRSDPRVVVRERTNLRNLVIDQVDGQPVDLVVADVSFISLTLLISPLTRVLADTGTLLLMVKPQFEVGREQLGKGGVVRSVQLHQESIVQVVGAAEARGWHLHALSRSRLPGPAGNMEYFTLFRRTPARHRIDIETVVADAYAVAGDPGT